METLKESTEVKKPRKQIKIETIEEKKIKKRKIIVVSEIWLTYPLMIF